MVVHADVLARRPAEEPRLVHLRTEQPEVMTALSIDPGVCRPTVPRRHAGGDLRQLVEGQRRRSAEKAHASSSGLESERTISIISTRMVELPYLAASLMV